MRYIIGFTTAIAVLAQPALARDEIELAPSSEWHSNYADDSCRLLRTFGEGEQQTMLYLEQFEPGDRFQQVTGGRLLGNLTSREGQEAELQFGPSEEPFETGFSAGTIEAFDSVIIVSETGIAKLPGIVDFEAEERGRSGRKDPEASEWAQDDPTSLISQKRAEAITWFALRDVGKKDLVLQTGSLGKPLAALNACTDELLSHWGIDVAAHRGLSREVVPANYPGRWISPSDYPRHLILKGVQGLVHFRLIVDPKGVPASCHIQKSTRPQEFDEVVCENLMENARFEPALDAAGEPITSFYRSTVRFQTSG